MSGHIRAYLRTEHLSENSKSACKRRFLGRNPQSVSVVAMQKVEGSNPFSRFFANALHIGGFGSAGDPRTNWNHPRIR